MSEAHEPHEPRVVVITGASAGVGRAVAAEFARRGDCVALLARGRAGLTGAADEVSALGGTPLPIPADVADPGAVAAAADRVVDRWGRIDIWVNNAMTSVFSPVTRMRAVEYRRVTEVTYLGVVHGTLAALQHMTPRDQGVIIQVGSALAYRSIPLQSAYCAAKHAIVGFTDSLRSELLHDESGIRVTIVHLPAMNTPQFEWVRSRLPHAAQPVPPIFEPEVAARAIEWASRHDRREVWVGASTWKAIIGERVAAGFADRYLARHGYEDQQIADLPAEGGRDNLWDPVDDVRDFGAHGRFGPEARRRSRALWFSEHRRVAGVAAAALVALGAGVIRKLAGPL
ncbi:MAG: SDR family oxidoreductase [Gemmatimonadales bacterium]